MKGVFGKVVWVGRATVFLVGVAVILALVFGVASTSFAHGGYKGLFHLGHSQTARSTTTLVGNILDATKSALVLQNTGGGSALELQVNRDAAPLKVNADAGKATNLDADKIDGKDSTAFRVSCPSGMQLFVGLCFETLARPEANFENATVTCAAAGRRLPTSVEANAWARQPGTPLQPGSWNSEWTGDVRNLSSSPTSLIVWIPVNQTTPILSEVLQSGGYRFRCVIPPSN